MELAGQLQCILSKLIVILLSLPRKFRDATHQICQESLVPKSRHHLIPHFAMHRTPPMRGCSSSGVARGPRVQLMDWRPANLTKGFPRLSSVHFTFIFIRSSLIIVPFETVYSELRRSQWPGGLQYEPSSPARTLGLWVRIPLKAWMSVYVYYVSVLFFVGSCLATG
jgi:hypothetical protein